MGTSTSYWTGRLRRLAGITTVTSADADSWTPCGVDCADRDGLVRKGEVPSHPRPIFRGAPRIWGPLHLCHATKCSRTRLLNNDSTIITSDHIEPHSCFPRFGSSVLGDDSYSFRERPLPVRRAEAQSEINCRRFCPSSAFEGSPAGSVPRSQSDTVWAPFDDTQSGLAGRERHIKGGDRLHQTFER